MHIYGFRDRFDQFSGKKYQRWVKIETRCDFTGDIIESPEECQDDYFCSYFLDYEDMDPCFSESGKVEGLKDIHTFLSQTYHFKSIGGSNNKRDFAECIMMETALKQSNNKNSIYYQCFTFDEMCRKSRIMTANNLIARKIIEPDQLCKDRCSNY